jgi:hypothetical protein
MNPPSLTSTCQVSTGYSLVEAMVASALLGAATLGLATSLGQASELASRARARVLERTVLDDAALPVDPITEGSGWDEVTVGQTRCWRRATRVDAHWVWVEARCRGSAADLPAQVQQPGLLVRR